MDLHQLQADWDRHGTIAALRALIRIPAHRAEAPWLALALPLAGLAFTALYLALPA